MIGWRWPAEFAGVALIALGLALWWPPIGIAIAGVYLCILANSTSGGE